MGFLSQLFEPKDFNGKVEKLFKWYESHTKFVSLGMIKDWGQLRNAIIAIASVLDTDTDMLSYDELKEYGDLFGTVISRFHAARFLNSNTVIANTAEYLLSRYPFLQTIEKSNSVISKLLDIM